jgi:hypothetical protein
MRGNIPGGINTVLIMALMITDFQAFRAATITIMESSTSLANRVTGGLARKAQQTVPGAVTWIMRMAVAVRG